MVRATISCLTLPLSPALTSHDVFQAGLISGSMRVTVDATTEGEENVIHISLANERFLRDAPDAPGPDNPNGDATADGDAAPSGAVRAAGPLPLLHGSFIPLQHAPGPALLCSVSQR